MKIFRVTLPQIVSILGLGKKVREFMGRVIHINSEALPTAAAMAGVTQEQWRRVEAVQQQIVTVGIMLRVE